MNTLKDKQRDLQNMRRDLKYLSDELQLMFDRKSWLRSEAVTITMSINVMLEAEDALARFDELLRRLEDNCEVNASMDAFREIWNMEDIRNETCVECAKDMAIYADSLCDPLKERISELEAKLDILESKACKMEAIGAECGKAVTDDRKA